MSEAIVPPPLVAEERPNPFQRIAGVLFAPATTFESIARRPDVLVPLIILLVVSVVSGVLIAGHVDFQAMAQEAMEQNPRASEMPAEQMAKMTRFTASFMRVSAYAAPLFWLLALDGTAGAMLLGFRVMGGEGNFKQAFSVTTYAWYPRLIKGVIATIILLSRKSNSIWEMQNPVRSNLGFLFAPKTQPVQFAIASSIDLFAIWSLVLLIIGFAAISQFSRIKSAVITVSLWVVVNLILLIGPAMQAMRLKQ
jgi:hypothetical protein